MSQDKQFLKYIPVSGEKHLGIAVVRWLGKIILRYKVMPAKDGSGYWVAAGSAKIGVKSDGKDNYEEWFQLDSNYDREEMKDFVLHHVEPILRQNQTNAFAPNPMQTNPNMQPAYNMNSHLNYANSNQGARPQQPATSNDSIFGDTNMPF